MKNIKLLPCPMCGREAEIIENSHPNYGHWFWAECTECHLRTEEQDHEENAIEQWNDRVAVTKLNIILKEKEALWSKTEYPRYLCAELKGYIEAIKYCRLLLLEGDKQDGTRMD